MTKTALEAKDMLEILKKEKPIRLFAAKNVVRKHYVDASYIEQLYPDYRWRMV